MGLADLAQGTWWRLEWGLPWAEISAGEFKRRLFETGARWRGQPMEGRPCIGATWVGGPYVGCYLLGYHIGAQKDVPEGIILFYRRKDQGKSAEVFMADPTTYWVDLRP